MLTQFSCHCGLTRSSSQKRARMRGSESDFIAALGVSSIELRVVKSPHTDMPRREAEVLPTPDSFDQKLMLMPRTSLKSATKGEAKAQAMISCRSGRLFSNRDAALRQLSNDPRG